jgi:hypothetical protein
MLVYSNITTDIHASMCDQPCKEAILRKYVGLTVILDLNKILIYIGMCVITCRLLAFTLKDTV